MTNENKSEQQSYGQSHGSSFIPKKENPLTDCQKESDSSEKLKQDLDRLALKIKILYGKK